MKGVAPGLKKKFIGAGAGADIIAGRCGGRIIGTLM
jgi:hypothetical protein